MLMGSDSIIAISKPFCTVPSLVCPLTLHTMPDTRVKQKFNGPCWEKGDKGEQTPFIYYPSGFMLFGRCHEVRVTDL
jgi:hypothetical protein